MLSVDDEEDDLHARMLRRLITLGDPKKIKWQFQVERHGNFYSGRYIKYRGQKIIVVWRRSDVTDADLVILDGKMKEWQKALN